MDPTIMIVLAVGLSCDGDASALCRVFADPNVSRGEPALSSAAVEAPSSHPRSRNALRDLSRPQADLTQARRGAR